MRLRKIMVKATGLVSAVLLAAGTLAGCVSASDVKADEPTAVNSTAPATSIPSTPVSTTSTAGITSAASSAASTNTELASGQVTVTIDGRSVTLSGAYVIDGVDAVIDGGSYSSTTSDQAVFLVVGGGSLTIKNAAITKSGDTANEEQSNFYGFNSAVLVAVDSEETRDRAISVARRLRERGIACEVAPKADKFGRQIRFAERRGIPFVWFGANLDDSVKDIRSGEQLPADPDAWSPPIEDATPRVVLG